MSLICGMNLEKTATLVGELIGVTALFECVDTTSWFNIQSKFLSTHIW